MAVGDAARRVDFRRIFRRLGLAAAAAAWPGETRMAAAASFAIGDSMPETPWIVTLLLTGRGRSRDGRRTLLGDRRRSGRPARRTFGAASSIPAATSAESCAGRHPMDQRRSGLRLGKRHRRWPAGYCLVGAGAVVLGRRRSDFGALGHQHPPALAPLTSPRNCRRFETRHEDHQDRLPRARWFPISTPGACSSAQDDLVVEIHTDEGLVGIGETDTNPWVARECIRAQGTHCMGLGLEEMLLGADPLEPEAIWRRLYSGSKMTGRRGALICALGALDMALWDIRGQALGQPIWKLLGGAADRPHVTPYASLLPTGRHGRSPMPIAGRKTSKMAQARWAIGRPSSKSACKAPTVTKACKSETKRSSRSSPQCRQTVGPETDADGRRGLRLARRQARRCG